MSFFDLPHIFVVFPPGGSGNFLNQLIRKLINFEFDELSFSETGNSHERALLNHTDNEILSCGIRYNIPEFASQEDKIDFYTKKINTIFFDKTNPQVGWTHDYSNIDIYKKIYPNSKILVVTQWNTAEKLAVLIQQELKNRLDPAGFVFVDDTFYKSLWEVVFFKILKKATGLRDDLIFKIISDKDNPEYFPIVAFITIKMMLSFYQFDPYQDNSKDVLNNCIVNRFDSDKNFDPNIMYDVVYGVGRQYKDYITEDCVQLPYTIIMKNDYISLLTTLESVMDCKFTSHQVSYVRDTLDSYFNKQNNILMSDPLKYLSDLKMEFASALKTIH
jgi:hypothetical protein